MMLIWCAQIWDPLRSETIFVLPYLRYDFCGVIMLTSNTKLVGESAASALTLVGKKKFICNQNHSCCTSCSRACAALAASPGVWRKDCPEPGWAGVGGSQCGCLQWESWEDWNSNFLIGNMKAVGFSCRIPWKYETILAGGFSSTAAVVGPCC